MILSPDVTIQKNLFEDNKLPPISKFKEKKNDNKKDKKDKKNKKDKKSKDISNSSSSDDDS